MMAKPTDLVMPAFKRLGRHLRYRPRLVFQMPFQAASTWDVYTDTDWAGCARTQKSTSGGCLMLGKHVIKCCVSTQASLALSSGEVEYYGVVRGTGIGFVDNKHLEETADSSCRFVWGQTARQPWERQRGRGSES